MTSARAPASSTTTTSSRRHAAVAVEVLAGGDPGVVEADQGGLEGGVGGKGGQQVPVAGGDERHPLALALDHEPHRGRLHASRRQARGDLAPQHLGHRVAEEPVDDAAGLLGVDEPAVDVARVLDRLLDGVAGDLVEHHAPHRHPGLQHLGEVPGDGLALAVLIGREVELVGILQGGLEPADDVLRLVGHHVGGLEVVVDVDGEALRLEVADRTDRRLDDVVVAEEPAMVRALAGDSTITSEGIGDS